MQFSVIPRTPPFLEGSYASAGGTAYYKLYQQGKEKDYEQILFDKILYQRFESLFLSIRKKKKKKIKKHNFKENNGLG